MKRLMSMVAMLVLILGVSAVGVRGLDACHEDCISDCRDSRVPSCYAQCVRERCNPPLAASLGHCELGCKVTKCNGLKSGTDLIPQYLLLSIIHLFLLFNY